MTKKTLYIVSAVVVVVALVIGVIVAVMTGSDSEETSTSTLHASSQHEDGEVVFLDGYPTAEDVSARTWPRPYFSDGLYRPGTWATSPTGANVYTPTAVRGEVLGKPVTPNAGDLCAPENYRDLGKITVQYLHGRFFLFSDSHGPGSISETGILKDYARTPLGALLGMYNASSAALIAEDELAHVAMDSLIKLSEESDEERRRSNYIDFPIPLPQAYRIESCVENLAVVQYAVPTDVDLSGNLLSGQSWIVTRLPMIYKEGQWIMQVSRADIGQANTVVDQLHGFVELEYR